VSQAIQQNASPQAKTAERFYLPELDVLRFFAFFGVFVWHVAPSGGALYQSYGVLGSLGTAGAFGVDLFFTLSGYLLTKLLLREREQTGDINVKAFYIRRTLRIWPLYYFSLVLVFLLTRLPVSLTSAPPFLGGVFPPMTPSTYFFLAIFLFNFNCPLPLPFMVHLWSISVEEQFYLFWPWIMRYVSRRRIVAIPVVMIVVAVIARAISLPLKLNTSVWNNTFTRLDPIAVGILIALLPRLNPRPAVRPMLVLIGLLSWMFAAYHCGLPGQLSTLDISLGYPAVALGSGAFVLATLGIRSLSTNSALARCLIYLGKISYGLYVYSGIAIPIAKIFLFRGVLEALVPSSWASWTTTPTYILFAFGLNVALAAASYRWLEAPFLRLKERFTRVPSREV
jgi:peptidoglycan/LPS O-acetylase OafA/YrhL